MNKPSISYDPTLYHFSKPFIGLTLLILVGTLGYAGIEKWSFIDSLFMSVETLTTVGYGFLHPLSVPGKIFTLIYIIFGVILFLYFAAEFAQHVFMANFDRKFKLRSMEHKIKKLKNHYIVCGFGRTGSEIVSQLGQIKRDFVVIDKSDEIEGLAKECGFLYINGDATDDDILQKAGIERAKGMFCALSADVDNLYLTVSAKNINSELKIITRCVKASNETKFKKAGASNVIMPYEISARRMVASVVKPHVVDFLDVAMHSRGHELELEMEQYNIKEKSYLEGKTILSSKLREKTGVIIVAIKRNGYFETNPTPDTIIKRDDCLIVIGTSQQLNEVDKLI